jgi:CDP-diacylglycerol--glycerol-3-phosphate 3-phosphatidyltransferase
MHILAFSCFIVFGLTDFFDGYFARRNDAVSHFGAALDPLADKCMIAATGIALLAMQKLALWVVVLFIVREFVVLTLRCVALQHAFQIVVSQLGKVKTASQIIFFAFLILSPEKFFAGGCVWIMLAYVLQYIAVGLTILSLWAYSFEFLRTYAKQT